MAAANKDSKQEATAPARPQWQKITPDHLLGAIEHMRGSFETDCWRCSQVTQKFCYCSLHPNASDSLSLSSYSHALQIYLGLLRPRAQDEFQSLLNVASPPSFFRAYFDLYFEMLGENVRSHFNSTVKIGVAHWNVLNTHPVDWAKFHLALLIEKQSSSIERWIKDVCDTRELPEPERIKEEFEEIVFWRKWRAPKFLYMQPAGNARYDEKESWIRLDDHHTQELLVRRSRRFIEFLSIALAQIAGAAHIEIAQNKDYAAKIDDLKKTEISENGRAAQPKNKQVKSPNRHFAQLPRYTSELKRAILMQFLRERSSSDIEICRALDETGNVELPITWKARPGDRLFAAAYKNPQTRRKVEIAISKVRNDLRKLESSGYQ